jgi:hypothetical protein
MNTHKREESSETSKPTKDPRRISAALIMGALLSLAIAVGVLVRNGLVRRSETQVPNPSASVGPVDGRTVSQASPRLDGERGSTTRELTTGETGAEKDIDPRRTVGSGPSAELARVPRPSGGEPFEQSRPPTAIGAPVTDLKAAFLYNFLKLITFPSHAFENASSPYRMFAQNEAIAARFRVLMGGKSIGGRSIEISSGPAMAGLTNFHLFYFEGDSIPGPEVVERINNSAGALTVGERPDFLDKGGMIQFVLSERLRFRINTNAIASAGTGLSSSHRVFNLAESLAGGPERFR